MHATFSAPLDPSYLDPDISLLVIREDHELAIGEAFQALDGLAWIFQEAAEAALRAEKAKGSSARPCVYVPPEGMAALIRVVAEKLQPALDNPPIRRVLSSRPDLLNAFTGGVS
jgi:hypothetical protein